MLEYIFSHPYVPIVAEIISVLAMISIIFISITYDEYVRSHSELATIHRRTWSHITLILIILWFTATAIFIATLAYQERWIMCDLKLIACFLEAGFLRVYTLVRAADFNSFSYSSYIVLIFGSDIFLIALIVMQMMPMFEWHNHFVSI